MLDSNDPRATRAIDALTKVAALSYAGWALFLFSRLYRVTRLAASSQTASVWEDRIEGLGFLAYPENLASLALPATAAAVATYMAGPLQQLGLAVLLRLIRWSATLMVVIAVLSTLEAALGQTGGFDQFGTISFRIGGGLVAAAIVFLCLSAGRTAPGG